MTYCKGNDVLDDDGYGTYIPAILGLSHDNKKIKAEIALIIHV